MLNENIPYVHGIPPERIRQAAERARQAFYTSFARDFPGSGPGILTPPRSWRSSRRATTSPCSGSSTTAGREIVARHDDSPLIAAIAMSSGSSSTK